MRTVTQDERAAMRQRLRDWGSTAPDKQRARRNEAQRRYEHAREDYAWAQKQLKHAPADKQLRASLRRVLALARRAAEVMGDAYESEMARMDELTAQRERVEDLISMLNGEQQELIHLRYCNKMSWLAISRRVYLSVSKARWHERIAVDQLVRLEGKEMENRSDG